MLRFAVAVLFVVVHLSLLATLHAAEPTVLSAPVPTEGEAAVLAALDQPTALDFAEQPLSDVLAFLARKHEIEIQMDNKALTDAGLGSDTPITMKLDNIRLRSALRLMLGELDLTYLARDGYLLITSKTEAENMLKIKAYAVRDLVTLDSPFRPAVPPGEPVGEDYAPLIDLITSTVAPTTWDEVGGPGSIKEFRNSHTISLSQTQEVHEELVVLLDALRRTRDRQLAAAKGLPDNGRGQRPRDEALHTYIYRLVAWPRGMPWPTGGMGTGAGMGGAGELGGGGMYYVADESAPAAAKPADAATPSNSSPPAKPTNPSKAEADGANEPPATPEFDVEQCEHWTKELAGDLPGLVEPETWQPQGNGSIRLVAGALVIRQTREVHEKLARFLAELLPMRVVTSAPPTAPTVRLPAPGPRLDWPQEAEPQAAGIEAQIEAGLAKKCDVEFRDTPLVAAVESLAAKTPIKVWIDHKALTDAGVGTDTPVTRSVHGVPIRAAFKLILGELDLTYVIRNEVLAITSKTEAENMLTTKVYPVFDLVASTSDSLARHARTPFRPIEPISTLSARPTADFRSLIDNITSNVGPTTWDEVGGPGAMREFVNAGALVISQTTELHEEIAEYLQALRQIATAQR